MVKNQLFRVLPDIEIIHSLLEIFGLDTLKDTKFFTKESLKSNDTANKLTEMRDELETYYLPCKAKNYITNITDKRCITILRQFIRIHGYTLISKERSIEGQKTIVYRLIEDNKESTPKKSETKKNIVISFE
jgi:hypothetical protein|tara:strand:+ start:3660 stop:4055 length:396 start_codon:yes stop_codon:yes gene_type:complete